MRQPTQIAQNLSMPKASDWGHGLRINKVAQIMGVCKNTIRNWTNPRSPYFNSEFPQPSRVGMRVLIWSEVEILDFLMDAERLKATHCRT